MLTAGDPPGTSALVVARTNFTVCVPELPATQMRPRAPTLSALAPTVNCIPAKLPKSFRRGRLFRLYPVRKADVPAGRMVVGSVAVSLLVLVSPPPDTVAVLVTLDGALLATFTVRVMAG